MREEDIIHRDFKPDNIFISNGVFKIGDFGISKKCDNYSMAKTLCGTPHY